MPIIYNKGLKASIDGKPVKINKVNYLMSNIKVDKNDKKVKITYETPFFKTSICGMLIGLILLVWLRKKYKL